METKNNKINISSFFLILLLFISIGFAMLSSNLNLNAKVSVKGSNWNIHFENIQVKEGSVENFSSEINTEKNRVTFSTLLEMPTDYLEFTVDVVNSGTIDGMLEFYKTEILNGNGEVVNPNFLEYKVSYYDDIKIEEKHMLRAKQKEVYKIIVKYKDGELAPEDLSLVFNLDATYIPADGTANLYKRTVCKKATTLHSETCYGYTGSNDGGKGCLEFYPQGSTIHYGSLVGDSTLKSGDAFDCDINADMIFDDKTERFYYVSPKDGNVSSQYATLIYYTALENGDTPTHNGTYLYDSDYTVKSGPSIAMQQLPSIKQWTHNRLTVDMTRNITYKDGAVAIPNFNYLDRSARLVTISEVKNACGITDVEKSNGELGTCQYFFENTQFAYGQEINGIKYDCKIWTETPTNDKDISSYYLLSNYSKVFKHNSNVKALVKPAIEVRYIDMEY